jgi:PAT family beta-lactamase induction signal transducer AmpG
MKKVLNGLLCLFPKAYHSPQMLGIILIGFASGLPLALIGSTLGVWLSEQGINKAAIGLFSLCGLFYSFKFLWSPFIDAFNIPILKKLGRRSGWIILIQICLMLSIIALGLTNPNENINATIMCTALVAFFSASHDIVIDAYRIETLKQNEQAAGASAAVLGYRLGMLFTTSGALFLSEKLEWFQVYTIAACGIVVGTITVLCMGEPIVNQATASKSHNTTSYLKQMIVEPFINFAQKKHWPFILLFILLFKLGEAFLGNMMSPFLLEVGFSKGEIASIVKTFGLAATLTGAVVGGGMLYRIGFIKALWITGILQMVSNLVFILQAHVGHHSMALVLSIFVENFTGGMATSVMIGYISSLCNINYTATQFALLSSVSSAGRTMLSSPAGFLVNMLGWKFYFVFTSIICIPGLLMIPFLKSTAPVVK